MKSVFVFLFAGVAFVANAQTYHNLATGTFLQNWSNTSLITADDIWDAVPSIRGYRGDNLVASTGADPRDVLSPGFTTPLDINANRNDPNNFLSGGISEFELADPVVAMQGSGTADAPFLVFFLNSTGVTGIRVKYKLRDIDGSTDNATQQFALQYRIGTTGDFINIPAGYIADASSGPGLATLVTSVDVVLPAACENQTELQIRIITTNAFDNDEWVGIDDIEISGNSGSDVTPPAIAALLPANAATNVNPNAVCTITFSEPVQKGTGTILIKKFSDNTTVQSIDIATASVTVSGSGASFNTTLAINTQYYIEMPAGSFKDLANNNFAGITNNTIWSFTTGSGLPTSYSFNFNTCSSSLSEGFTQFSVNGDSVWKCTTFGFINSNAVQISGFSTLNGSLQNEDWFISPALNLNGFDIPLLRFRSRTRFAGLKLKLFISTNYSGSGNPSSAIWKEINGKFPDIDTDTWTTSDSINLNNFKSSSTYIAWVYYSNPTDGAARWTLDDVSLFNSPTPPAASVTASEKLLNFFILPAGNTSSSKSVQFWANDVSGGLTVTAPAGFEISKDNSIFFSGFGYSGLDLQTEQTVFVRFKPSEADKGYGGSLQFSGTNLTANKVDVTGSSLDKSKSLDMVNWNIEWFGHPSNGPTDNVKQAAFAKTVMDSLNADIYVLQEIVDTALLGTLTRSLNGSYDYAVSLYSSLASNSNDPDWPLAQKLAYVYRRGMFTNISTRGFLLTNTAATDSFASGRVPFLMEADVTVDGITKRISFLNIHGKAGDSFSDYSDRRGGSKYMTDTLNTFFNTHHFTIAGDYNDDLDATITATAGTTQTPYFHITTDPARYTPVSLWNSTRGERSTFANPEVIDHVSVSNEMNGDYHAFSSILRRDVIPLITRFADSVSDHIPMSTRFNLRQTNNNIVTSVRNIIRDANYIKLLGNPSEQPMLQFGKNIAGDVQLRLMNSAGQLVWEKRLSSVTGGQLQQLDLKGMAKGVYTLMVVSKEGIFSTRIIR
jgi:hypothetical protein